MYIRQEVMAPGMRMTVFNGSPRKNGSDARILEEAVRTAEGMGYECETIDVYSLGIGGCRACMACKKTGNCVQKDGMNEILEKIRSSDIIVLASPIYFGAEAGPMKILMDRMYPMVGTHDGSRKPDVGVLKKVNVLLTCADPKGAMTYGSILSRYVSSFNAQKNSYKLGLNRFAAAGWENRLYLDHNGRFDNYLASFRSVGRVQP